MVTGSQVFEAREHATANGGSVVAALIALGFITEEDITRTVAAASNMEFVDLSQILVKPEVIDLLPRDKAYRYKAVPIALNDDVLVVAISDPLNFDTLDNLRFLLKREIEMVCATPEQIKQALVKYYGSAEEAGDMMLSELGTRRDHAASTWRPAAPGRFELGRLGHHQAGFAAAPRSLQDRGPATSTSNRWKSVSACASASTACCRRCRTRPRNCNRAIVSRLKIMSGTMSIAEKRLPQDGRIQVKMGKKSIDLRVSTIPTNHGESVVMRILDKSSLSLGLPELGFLTDDQGDVRADDHPAGRHPARHRADRLGQDDDALRLPERTSTGPTARSSRSRTRWNTRWRASTRCRSTPTSA